MDPRVVRWHHFYFIMEGVFIPSEFYKDKNLNGLERDVLALYKYYTENGKYKCCSLTCQQVADEFDISVWYINKIKKHLKDLGYIRSDGGVKVIYIGIQVGSTVPTQDCTTVQSKSVLQYSGSVLQYSADCTTVQSKSVPQYTHKKEETKKEIKKEEKRPITNFDLLLDRLPKDYLTPERIDYMKEHFMDRINSTDMSCGGIDSWVIGIKNELNRVYPMDYRPEKVIPTPVSDTIDLF